MKKPCTSCGGTGQVGSFLGVSRFLLTWEECPACCGTGLAVTASAEEPAQGKGSGHGVAAERGRKRRGK